MLKRSIVILAFFVSTLSTAAAPVDSTFTPGKSYFGRNSYIEYIAGNSPYIFSAPHDGFLTPAEIPDRTGNITTGHDSNVQDLIRKIGQTVFSREGRYPHIIICHLERIKLDADREIVEATQGNPFAIQAWKEYHSFIDTAAQQVEKSFGRGFYIDLHGYSSHPIQRLELGYLLSSTSLSLSDSELDKPAYGNSSSIRTMIPTSGLSFSQLLRGPRSLGSLFENRGYPAVPSDRQPNPGSSGYFNGGYNTQRHGSASGGPISAVQIECNMIGVRDSENARRSFAEAFAEVVKDYTSQNLFVTAVFDQSTVPVQSALLQNYPNPFNPRTAISFQLTAVSFVKLKVFDGLGREVATLVDEQKPAGSHTVIWNAQHLPSGMYMYRIVAGSYSDSKKMLLVK
jgi:N-formylglutamate amidohydrolase